MLFNNFIIQPVVASTVTNWVQLSVFGFSLLAVSCIQLLYVKNFLQAVLLLEVMFVSSIYIVTLVSASGGFAAGFVFSVLALIIVAVEGAVGLSLFLRTVHTGVPVQFSRNTRDGVFKSTSVPIKESTSR